MARSANIVSRTVSSSRMRIWYSFSGLSLSDRLQEISSPARGNGILRAPAGKAISSAQKKTGNDLFMEDSFLLYHKSFKFSYCHKAQAQKERREFRCDRVFTSKWHSGWLYSLCNAYYACIVSLQDGFLFPVFNIHAAMRRRICSAVKNALAMAASTNPTPDEGA